MNVQRNFNSVSRLSAVAAACAVASLLTSSVRAADKAWSTAPSSNAFSGTNFAAGQVAGPATTTLSSGDALFFGTSSVLVPNNDISGLSLSGITFNTGAGVFTIGGTTITLTGNIVNNSTAFQTFNNGFILAPTAAPTTITTNTGGMNINGPITGSGGGINKTGSGLLGLLSANTITGPTAISGTIFLGNSAALGTSAITINGAATGGAGSLSIGSGLTIANNIVSNGGGFTGIGVIQMPDAGTSTITGTITVNSVQNAGGTFTTGGSDRILRIQGDNTIISTVPISVRAGRVIYTGAQNYTTGTVFATNDARASLQFNKIVGMPASGTVSVAQGNSIIVNVGGAGEFTDGSGTTTAGTIGGLLGGVGGQGAPVSLAAGSTLGIDTSNATAPIVYNAPWQTASNTSAGLLKLGAGTLSLPQGGAYAGSGGTVGFPLVVRQGTVNLTGGTHAVTGETVIGGTFGTAAGASGLNASLVIDNGAILTTSTYLSIGRGNGVGVASSDLVVNNGSVTSGEFSFGFNGGSALNLPKGSMTLNNASTYTATGVNFNFAESAGSNGTLTLNGTSAVNLSSTTGTVHLGNAGNATVTLNDASTFTSASNNANFFIARNAGSVSTVTLNGTSKLVHNGAAGGTVVADGGKGLLNIASAGASVEARNLLIGHFTNGNGAVYNKGTMLGLSDGLFLGDAGNGSGYLLNDNGTAVTPNGVAGNIVAGISAGSNAVIDVASGTLSGTRVGVGFFQNVATNGQYNVSGGTLAAGATGFLVGDATGQTGNKFGNVNVTGGTLSSVGPINLAIANLAGNTGLLSITTGGKVVADTITATGTTSVTTVASSGGILQALAASTTPSLITANVRRLQLDAGGLTVDTNGVNKSIDTFITDPAGQGVTSVSLSGTGTGYIGRPLVKITDATGTGATAQAIFNPATGEVTGVTITSPGSGYQQPAVTISGGGGTALTGTAITDFTFGGTLTKIGAGTLSLTAANTYTGLTTVNGGTLSAKYSSTVASAATPLLTLGGADIKNGQVVFDYTGDPTSPASTVRGLLVTSYATGFTTGVLKSSAATATKGLGYKDDGTGLVTVKYTLYGDADLDGSVTIIDFNSLATNFGANTGKVWVDGDFTYDGAVGITDFNALAVNFGQSLPPADRAEAMAPLLAFAIAHNDLPQFYALTGVPEPTSLGLIAAGAVMGLRRRRSAR